MQSSPVLGSDQKWSHDLDEGMNLSVIFSLLFPGGAWRSEE